jgi:DNA-directed RNA polymerase specialized sigma24 family protein
MKKENEQMYSEVIDLWSKIYKKKIGDLFTFEELKQEAWLAVLKAEEKAEETASDKEAFLAQCVKTRLLTLFLNELKHRTTINGSIELANLTTPEEELASNEIFEELKINIKKIPGAEFVFRYMNKQTVREISTLAEKEGHKMSKSQVHKTISLIQKELDKIIRR